MWGDSLRQRLRLAPLYCALIAADSMARVLPRGRKRVPKPWCAGVSVIIPDRGGGEMLDEALASVDRARDHVSEPVEIIVVGNGVPGSAYDALVRSHREVRVVHSETPLGFSEAVTRGLAHARHDWTWLMNNDVTLEPQALARALAGRADDVFAIGVQIHQRDAAGRREETGFVDWHVDAYGVRAFHALPEGLTTMTPALAASGGAALFRTALLARYARESRTYDPFYWEDIEWGVRAWQDGFRVLFCPNASVRHRHRATTARYYSPSELERIVERNRLLFDARAGATSHQRTFLMERVCDLPYSSQRELAHPRVALQVLRRRSRSRASPLPLKAPALDTPGERATELASLSYSYRLRPRDARRPCVLIVTPFVAFPPRHGGARRIAGLVRELARDHDIVVVTDEASQHDARSLAYFDGLAAVHLVQRREAQSAVGVPPLEARMRTHCHPLLERTVGEALARYRPDIVQIEYAELAGLVRRRSSEQLWVLGLHDACTRSDFAEPAAAGDFFDTLLPRYDAVTVCSTEDAALVAHPRVVCVPNGSSVPLGDYRPSMDAELLFMGPFRYAPNLEGVRRFLESAYPEVRRAVPNANITVLGGERALNRTNGIAPFAQPGVTVLDHRDDVSALLERSTLTINPLSGIRGSPIKVIESLTAGRACVTTEDGARGFADAGLPGLVSARSIDAMAEPIVRLLTDASLRHRLERPDPVKLGRWQWESCAAILRRLYADLSGATS